MGSVVMVGLGSVGPEAEKGKGNVINSHIQPLSYLLRSLCLKLTLFTVLFVDSYLISFSYASSGLSLTSHVPFVRLSPLHTRSEGGPSGRRAVREEVESGRHRSGGERIRSERSK